MFGKKKAKKESADETKKKNLPQTENASEEEAKVPQKGLKIIKLLIILVMVTLVIVIIVQNLHMAKIIILGKEIQLPVIAVILIFLLVGYVLGGLTYSLIFRKRKPKKKRKRDQTEASEESE